MKKVGIIGVPGGWSSESLADRVADLTGNRLLIDMQDVYFSSEKKTLFYKDVDLGALDGIIVKKIGPRYSPDLLERLELLRFLEDHNGVKIFSKPRSIINCFDRLSNTLTLIKGDIPMPETVMAESVDVAVETVQKYGECVFKPLYSTKARGMEILKKDDADLREKIEKFKANNATMYIQKKCELDGKDLGLTFLGGKYVGTYARVGNKDSWNTTIHSGGKYEPYDPGDEIIELATKAQKLFDLDFTSVDVAFTPEGPVIFEVSAFGGFRGLHDSRGVDAAKLYAEYVVERV